MDGELLAMNQDIKLEIHPGELNVLVGAKS